MDEVLSRNGTVIVTESEINSSKTMEGNLIHIEDATPINAEECITTLEPIQDLHGYDKPWVGGGGKNLLSSPWEIGSIGATGQNIETEESMRSRDKIRVTPDTQYTFSLAESVSEIWANFYNNEAFVSRKKINTTLASYATFTVPQNVNQLRMRVNLNSASVIIQNSQLELGSTATSYEPYSNICPISGHTGVNLTRTGKNLLPMTVEGIKRINTGGTWNGNVYSGGQGTFELLTDDENNVIGIKVNFTSTTGIRDLNLLGAYGVEAAIIPTGTYKISMIGAQNEATLHSGYNTTGFATVNSSTEVTANATNGIGYVVLRIGSGVTVNNLIVKPMIRLASDTDPTYEPSTPEIHSITFPQEQSPVYSCKVNWTKGVLRVDRASLDITSEAQLSGFTASSDGAYASLNQAELAKIDQGNVVCICSSAIGIPYISRVANTYKNIHRVYSNAYGEVVVRAKAGEVSTQTELFNIYNGAQVVYKLATPIEIPLTPEVITLLRGENNIWTNVGTNTLTYQPNNVIGELKGEIQLLQSQINTLINQLNSLSN